jgi:hypothetical protein
VIRLVCHGSNGAKSIGVMMPEGQRLALSKRMTSADMKQLGIWDEATFRLMTSSPRDEMPTDFDGREKIYPESEMTDNAELWQQCHDPADIFDDEEIAHSCRNVTGALIRREGDELLFAVPIRGDAPFPMMPVFCFGEFQHINGGQYVVFKVKNGKLVV